jgi:hypothetical protein
MFSFVAYYQFKDPTTGESQTIALNHLGKDAYVFTAIGNYVREVSFHHGKAAHEYYMFKFDHFNRVFGGK